MKRRFALLAGLVVLLTTPAFAQVQGSSSFRDTSGSVREKRQVSQMEARRAVREGKAMPSHEIARTLARKYGGQLQDAKMYLARGRYYYDIHWRTEQGKRLNLKVDARNASVMSGG